MILAAKLLLFNESTKGILSKRKEKCKNLFIYLFFFVTLRSEEKTIIMALNLNKNLKLYYSIKEVAEMFDLNESTLRYWETEFPYLRPKTAGPSKVRQYTEKDIEQIKLIYNLVKVRGFKLAAARKMINANRDGSDRRAEVLSRLINIKGELQALKHQLDMLQ